MDPFQAFEERMTRRLAAMRHEVEVELNRLHAEAIKTGAHRGNRSIFPKLSAIESSADAATEFVLREAVALTDNRDHARDLWLEATADRARAVLASHVDSLYGVSWRADPNFLAGVAPAIDDSKRRTLEKVNGEVDDFSRGVWHPHSTTGPVGSTTNNNVYVGGSISGVFQQGGANAQQQATNSQFDPTAFGVLLEHFATAVAGSQLPAHTTGELMAEIDTIRAQLKKTSPNFDIVRVATGAIGSLCVGVGANFLTPHVTPLLAAVGLS